VRRVSFADMNCSVAQTLEVVGEWWSMLIVRDAFFGVRRFEDFHQRLGIARNVLTTRLQHLVDHGVLERRQYSERPPRHEYRLTEKGRDLYPVLVTMLQWGDKWAAQAGPPITLSHKGCGGPADAVLSCATCGERLGPRDIVPHAGPGARRGGRAALAPSGPDDEAGDQPA
jgi:DNA-binding HxlR family transcriptional regulator